MSESKNFYPVLPSGIAMPIKAILVHMSSNPGYLESYECPYPPDLKEILQSLHNASFDGEELLHNINPTNNIFDSKDKWEVMQNQYELTFSSLVNMRDKINSSNKTDKSVAFLKTISSTLEKLVLVSEKISQGSDVYHFKQAVFDALTNILTPEQRAEFIQSLKQD